MIPVLLAITINSQQPRVIAMFDGEDVGIRVVEQNSGLRAEFMVYDRQNGFVVAGVTGLPGGPSLDFKQAKETATGVELTGGAFTATIEVPKKGGVFSVAVSAKAQAASLNEALFAVALAPMEKPIKAGFTFTPPAAASGLVTQDLFVTPLILASGGGYGIALMPDVDDLVVNRPMSPVMQLTNDGRTSPGAMLSYGFVPYDRDEDWSPKRADRKLDNPEEFSWRFDLLVTSEATAVSKANTHLWNRNGKARFRSPLPQTVPFRYYTKPTYALSLDGGDDEEEEERGTEAQKGEIQGLWWVSQMAGKEWRAPRGKDRQAKLTIDGNIARFAWGLRWWGDHLEQTEWSEHADEVMRLVAATPTKQGMMPASFDLSTKAWRFESADTSSVAFNARWVLKYADLFFSTSGDDLFKSAALSARSLMKEHPNGVSAVFMQECLNSKSIDDSLKNEIKAFLADSKTTLSELAEFYAKSPTKPDVDTVSLALYLARAESESERSLARTLVDRMFLYQALWQPPTVKGTEIFGAFVGKHFSEESQSNFSADLLEAAVQLGDRQLADRAIAALRAPLALFAHSTHSISGMILPPTFTALQSSSWFGQNGMAEFGEWRGIAEGVGQTLTSLADATRLFGSYYTHADGWTVGIDGVFVEDGGKVYSAFSNNPLAFEGVFPFEHVDAMIGNRTRGNDPENYPAMRSIRLERASDGLYVVALPGFTALNANGRLRGAFRFADGRTERALVMATGLGVKVSGADIARGPVSFEGNLDQIQLSVQPTFLVAGPPAADVAWPLGWRRMMGLSDIARTSLSVDGQPVISTADNGRGGRSQMQTGVIESQAFLVTESGLKFTMLGKADKGTHVELVDVKMGVPIMAVQKQIDGPEEITWELFDIVGQSVVFRIIDESKTSSIEVRDLRATKIGPN